MLLSQLRWGSYKAGQYWSGSGSIWKLVRQGGDPDGSGAAFARHDEEEERHGEAITANVEDKLEEILNRTESVSGGQLW